MSRLQELSAEAQRLRIQNKRNAEALAVWTIAHTDLINAILQNAPKSWNTADRDAETITVEYVRALEDLVTDRFGDLPERDEDVYATEKAVAESILKGGDAGDRSSGGGGRA